MDRDAARHHFIDKRRWFGYAANSRSVQDAFGRGYSRKRSGSGARARSDTLRSRAASGIMLAGIRTGAERRVDAFTSTKSPAGFASPACEAVTVSVIICLISVTD